MIGNVLCRYSNTLLVSLNNRISVREGTSVEGMLPRPRAIAIPPSRAPSGIPQVRLEKVTVSQSFNQGVQSGGDGTREGIIGEYCVISFLVCLSRIRSEQQISHHLWFQWQARMPPDSLIECTLQDRGYVMSSIHAAKVRIIPATVSIIVELNTVTLSGHWVFRAALALCSHGVRPSLFKNV